MALVAVVAVGLVLRILWAVQMEPPQGGELRDPVLYMILADHVADGDGFRYGYGPEQGVSAYYPPGYPLTLGAATWLAGPLPGDVSSFDVAVWMNVALSVATIALMFVLGRRLVGPRVGLVAAGVWALWPNLVFHSGVVLTETLFLFLLVLMLIVALGDRASARSPGVARLTVVGLLFGAVLLVRPVSAVVAPVFLLLWWPNGVRAALWRLAVVGVATVAVLVPWAIRSTAVMDEPVLMSLNFGDNLCIGHNPDATGGFRDLEPHCYTAEGVRRPESETRRNSENIDRAVEYITENPGTTLRRTLSKLRLTVQHDDDGLFVAENFGAQSLFADATRTSLRWVATGFYVGVGLLAVGGGIAWLRRGGGDRRGLFLVVGALAQLLPPLATFGDPRFKMPIYPALAVCAAVALVALLDRFVPARRGADTAVAAPADAGAGTGSPAERPAEPSPAPG